LLATLFRAPSVAILRYDRYKMDTEVREEPPAAERVYQHVRQAVLERRVEVGTLLTEGQIAAEVGVSRTPVREGLLRLEAQGLLRLYPKRGALVLPISGREADDVFEARELIETFAATKVWPRRARLVERLEPVLARMRERRAADDVGALMTADREFHALVVEEAGNGVLAKLYESLRDRQMLMGVAALRVDPERMDRAVDEHAEMLDVLRDGDERQFRRLVHRHVTDAARHLRTAR
jgi:DNA-binding GntR family transcriptional regulator